ncbi:hypothetical protein [Nocardia gipuzkoensis]|uniref:hypothetical protein n=1 Tax=Nocardia gipuzkoensis TaxID=2749991 RepID=UPI0015EED218|nr:hypothetical protein [Nocardia gipuzkoensis]
MTVGVDHGDLTLAAAAVQVVRRIVDETDAGEVVIDGIAQLPSGRAFASAEVDVLSALADTVDVLVEFAERLEERGERVHRMPFGWHKDCHTEAVEGPGARQVIQLSTDGDVRADPLPPHASLPRVRRRGRWVTGD